MKYESGEFVPLDYKNLRIDYAYEENPFYDSPGDFSVDYHVPEFTYWADMIRVAEEIYEWEDRSDNIPKEYEDKEYDYIEANFEELVNKYKQKLMDYFEDEAADVLLDLYLYERRRDEAITDGENYYPPNFKPAKGKTYSYYLEGYEEAYDFEDDQHFTSDDFIEFSKEIIDKVEDHYEDLDPSFFLTDLYMDNDKDVLHIEIDDDDIGTFAVDQKIDRRKVKTPDQVKIYTKEILDKFIKQIDVVVKKNIQKIKRKKFLYEASYGGAYDIDNDQYFTKEELIEFADEIIEKIEDHYREMDPHFFITDLYMDEDKNVLHLEIEDDNLGTFFIDQKIDYRKVKTPYQIRNYTKEILDKFIKQIDSLKEALSPADYSPKQTGIAYKVFKVKNGKLYPPMVSNKNNEPTPVGVWLDAEEGEFAGLSKTGRPQVKSIGSGNLSYRPGWHLGDIPRAKQFDRRNKETGEMEFPKDFVWAECEYAMDVDYQPESDARGYERTHIDDKGNVITTKSDKYQHSLAGLPKLPKDGYYKYRTNPNPDTVPWIITGQMKVNKLLSDDEVNEILKSKGVEPIHRQGGDKTLKELGL